MGQTVHAEGGARRASAGDRAGGDTGRCTIEIVHRPDHEVTVAFQFRAVTTERELLPRLLAAGDALHPEAIERARVYMARQN